MTVIVGTITATKAASPVPLVRRDYSAAAQTVPAGGLSLTFSVSGLKRIMIQLTAATAALTGLTIGVIPNTGGNASTIASVAADFTNPKGIMVGASGDLTTLNAAVGWFILDVQGLDSIIITATSGGTATLALAGGGA